MSSNGKMFNYDRDALAAYKGRNPSKLEALRQRFDPRRLGAMLMIELSRLTNESINIKDFAGKYELKFDKILCFRYSDLPLNPFFFTSTAGQLILLKDYKGDYNTMLESDLNTLINILYGNVTLAKARRDGKVLVHGEKYAHDETVFFEIFKIVAPKLRERLQAGEL